MIQQRGKGSLQHGTASAHSLGSAELLSQDLLQVHKVPCRSPAVILPGAELPYPPAGKYYIQSTDNDKNIAFKPKIFHLLVCGEAAQQETGPVPHHVLCAALGLGGLSEHKMRSLVYSRKVFFQCPQFGIQETL